ncbi:MAG: 16S rRNA (cytosine(1402)-N(4))-methyltransferase RsmH [Termitinemataceae bacterium]|nr:MAG: 16S rRNA (cytosine(1402)-N(4))-methyltransferase RsmH [Termitinemataceae bacterium]
MAGFDLPDQTPVHQPVLVEETISLLGTACGGVEFMIDGTLGEGGHSEVFLSRFADLQICGVDADEKILQVAKARLEKFGGRISYYHGWSENFFAEIAKKDERHKADIILIDLGVSLYHYEKGDRGFSFGKNEALDMRIDINCGEPASDLVNNLGQESLAGLLFNNADEHFSRRIAKAIVRQRSFGKITTSSQLAEIVAAAYPYLSGHSAGKKRRGGNRGGKREHPATKTFQALRIAVNGELYKLPPRLQAALDALKCGGRLGVISFHSIEDRIVKNFFRDKSRGLGGLVDGMPKTDGTPIIKEESAFKIITKKAVPPTYEETQKNPASRSAKLRVIQKVSI